MMMSNEYLSVFTGDFHPLFSAIDELMKRKERIIVAIDGNCAAGKTSLALSLASKFACNVIPMDDFFLRPYQRTPERLREPGGNIDYERFRDEVVAPLVSGERFSYRPYDCGTEELSAPVFVAPRPLNVIEGVYSLHPFFSAGFDIRVFLRLGAAEQRNRLSDRSPGLFDRFIDEWIPMENRYFEHFKIPEKCDLVFGA